MSIADKITQLTNIRAAIRSALANKGVSASDHDFADFAADIAAIPTSFSLQSKSVSPSTSQQVVRPDSGYDGLSQVTVAAVPLQSKNVTPNAAGQTVTPDSGYLGLSQVVLPAEGNLSAGNIKSGVSIFGVNGSYAPSLQNKSVTPGAVAQEVQADSNYYGLNKVTVAGDADLIAANIKKGVNIFGVSGVYTGEPGSLIVCDCPASTSAVTATYGGTTVNAVLIGTIAYVTIPYTYTGTVTITATYTIGGTTQVGSTSVTITAVDKYTCSIESAVTLYSNGSWNTALLGGQPSFTLLQGGSGPSGNISYNNGPNSLTVYAATYVDKALLFISPRIPTTGFSNIRVYLQNSSGGIVAVVAAAYEISTTTQTYGSVRKTGTASGYVDCPLNGATNPYLEIRAEGTYNSGSYGGTVTVTKIELV